MGYKDDNYSTKVCGHHPETCTCRDWDTKEERERGITITHVGKQETLEDAAEKYGNTHQDVSEDLGKYLVKAVFQDGAKWQQERMYSEEEVREAFKQSRQANIFQKNMPPVYESFEEWLDEFKKK